VSLQQSCRIFRADFFPLVTPLRYPGAKQWFVSRAMALLSGIGPSTLVEPFAGGAVVGLSLLAGGLFDRLILVEKDQRVAAFWREALRSDALARNAAKFKPTPQSVRAIVSSNPSNDKEWAFWVYVKNRASFNGLLDGGLSREENWRFKIPGDLYQVRSLASRITLIEGNALEVLQQYNSAKYTAFLDPPYFLKADQLYREHQLDHRRLFETLAGWTAPWILTYDDCLEIRRLATEHRMAFQHAPMRDGRHRKRQELVLSNIFPDAPVFDVRICPESPGEVLGNIRAAIQDVPMI
jgi:DNA adenine methylase